MLYLTPTERIHTTYKGIHHEANRQYSDPYLNRWVQPDSIIPDIYNPLDLDRYSYSRNNPINFNDPTGHMSSAGDGGGGLDDRDLTDWIVTATVYMANDPETQSIREMFEQIDTGLFIYANFKFFNMVRDGSRFDVKDKIKDTLGETIKLGDDWFEYSTAGNILYGFYGTAAGYDEETLHLGAGVAQAWDHYVNKEVELGPFNKYYTDTPDDYEAVKFGVALYIDCYLSDKKLTILEFYNALMSYKGKSEMALRNAPSNIVPKSQTYAANYFNH